MACWSVSVGSVVIGAQVHHEVLAQVAYKDKDVGKDADADKDKHQDGSKLEDKGR